jgi:hypothetical protein
VSDQTATLEELGGALTGTYRPDELDVPRNEDVAPD